MNISNLVVYKIKLEKRERDLLCRVNGIGSELIIDRESEIFFMVEVMHKLSDSTVHAKYYNGIVYDFIEGIPIETQDIPAHAEGIAAQLAKFNKLDIEGDREPKLFKVLDNWIKIVKGTTFDDPSKQKLYESIQFEEKIIPEIEMMKKVLDGWEIAFCHNDLLGYNVIYNEKENKYSFIDYEYCGYNYIAFDIGDHFFEYLGVQVYDPNAYPNEDQQVRFIKAYLQEYTGKTPSERDIEILRRKSNIGGLCSNLFWGTWSIFQAKNSSIDFDYLSYGHQRFNTYFNMKEKLFQDPNEVQ